MIRSSAISRGICLALLATAAQAQTVAAGARAVVSSETLSVYPTMSESGAVKATLTRGDAVVIGLVLFGDEVTWCAIARTGETRRLGYASCEFLEPERAGSASSTPAPAPPPKPRPTPIPIREVPPVAITLPDAPAVVVPALTPAPSLPLTQPTLPPPEPVAAPVKEVLPPEPVATPVPVPEPARPETVAPPLPIGDGGPLVSVVPSIPIRELAPPEPAPASVPAVTAPTTDQNDFVEAALDGSGLRQTLASYTQTTRLLSFLDKGRLADLDAAALDRVLAAQFQPRAFSAAIGEQIQKNYSPERLPPMVEWLRSPATRKVAELERRALLPESREELVAFAAGLSNFPPAESRLLLAHRLFDSLKTCDMEVEATIAIVHSVARAIAPVLPVEKRYGAAELDRALSAVKTRYRSIMRNARLVHYLFAYQTVSDEELEQYVGFLESDSGKWFVSLVDKGFYDATGAISRNLLAEIPRNVKPKRR